VRLEDLRLRLALSSLLGASAPASAAFHLWQMNELYSNADGTVQFLELTALAPMQQFVQNHTLVTVVTSTTAGPRVFTFPSNLPGDTAGRRMLIGTLGFANLGVVVPDYVVPNGFFPLANGSIAFGEGADAWTYSYQIGFCGGLSFARNGSTRLNSPTNFMGQTGALSDACPIPTGTPPPTPTPTPTPTPPPAQPPTPGTPIAVQALWWRSPAGSENGWGLNIAQQGEKLFATWFTYDADGAPLWFVMDDARKVGIDLYFGTVYQTTGAPFSAYDAARFRATAVGVATLAFSDVNTGTFTYTVNGITERKPITRFIFAHPVPTCSITQAVAGGNNPNYQDLWWRSPAGSEPGWGVNIVHQGDTLFATWFTYAGDGRGLWLVADNAVKIGAGVYRGTVYQARGARFDAYDASRFSAVAVGTATFAFSDASNGTFNYTVNGITQTKPITRYVFARPSTGCWF
jgi:hypothetical protein